MKLVLIGHDYKYAAEQILLMMFPQERPEYDTPQPGELYAQLTISIGEKHATASTKLFQSGKTFYGTSRISCEKLTDKLETDRLLQKILKLSFFKAASQATGKKPVWGALTGIRPAKLVTNMLSRGYTENRAKNTLIREYFVSPERAELCVDASRASREVKSNLSAKDIALYIGIPFCPTRCAYCSFVSQSTEKSIKLIDPFLEVLSKEIDAAAKVVRDAGLIIRSVYLGGGTPTTLSSEQLDLLLNRIENSFDLSHVVEYSVEAGRPDTITREKLEVMHRHSVSRISVNPQTMSDNILQAIGRRHTAQDIREAVVLAQSIGFKVLNMDLIAGLPTDTAEGFYRTLDEVLDIAPENITVHTLSLKKGSRITLEGTDIPDGNTVGKMLDYASQRLRSSGYVPYYMYRQKFMSGGFENIGWCRPGYESFYNICIMEELCSILALGGGAVTKLVAPSGRIERKFNAKYPLEYIENIAKAIEGKEYVRSFYTDIK